MGGGGNSANRPRRPNNNNRNGGGGGNNKLDGGLYQNPNGAGGAAANLDPRGYFQGLLTQLGQWDTSGSDYGNWKNTAVLDSLFNNYTAAQGTQRDLNPIDWAMRTYGAGYTGKKADQFQGGSLGSLTAPTADAYQDYLSTQDPGKFLTSQWRGQGIGGGPNQGFNNFLNTVMASQYTGDLAAAQAAGQTSSDPLAIGGTNPVGVLGGDVETAQRQGRRRHRGNDPYQIPTVPPATTTPIAPSRVPITLNDFLRQKNLLQDAQQAYAFRGNDLRQVSPIQLAGRYSWWT